MQIVIAGGGPGGATCARALSKAGIRTVLIEASPSAEKPCAGGLPSVLFEHYKIPNLLIKQRATSVIFQAPSGYRVKADFPEGQYIATVNRGEFDTHLRWIAEDSGAIMVTGRVLSYEEKGQQFLVRYRDNDGTVRTTEADFVVGADGAYSRIAMQAMGSNLPMVTGIQEEIAITDEAKALLGDSCVFNYSPAVSPDFYGWIFPKGNKVSVGIGSMGKNRDELLMYLERMKELHSDILKGGKVITRNGALIPSDQYKQYGNRRIILVGDAAGLVLPACGEGIYFAMRSGEIAGEVIADMGLKRPDILVSRYTDIVNAEFRQIFGYFRKVQRIAFSSPVNREVFVRLTRDKFMARKILSAFSTKERRRTPFFKKIGVSMALLGIRAKVHSISKRPDFGK